MKKWIWCLLSSAMLFTFCACQCVTEKPESYETTTVETFAPRLPGATTFADTDKYSIEALLRGEKTFVDDETRREATVFSITEIDDVLGTEAQEYAVFDLDGDGVDELFIRYKPNGNTLILHMENGGYVGYIFPFRAVICIRENRTTDWSNSAFESGIGELRFTKSGLVFDERVVYNTEEQIFLVDGKPVSEEDCLAAMDAYSAAAEILWFAM